MSDTTTVNANEIVAALRNDPDISETSVDQLASMMGELAQIIGDRHDKPVTFVSLCEMLLAISRRLKDAGCAYDNNGKLDAQTRTLAMFEGDFTELLFVISETEDTAMLSPQMGLNDEMRRLYQSG